MMSGVEKIGTAQDNVAFSPLEYTSYGDPLTGYTVVRAGRGEVQHGVRAPPHIWEEDWRSGGRTGSWSPFHYHVSPR
jgi:hypothetical protein